MTASPEAPTLGDCITFMRDCTDPDETNLAIHNFLERLRAIVNAKGIPDCPSPEFLQHIRFEGRDCVVMAPAEYEALYLSHRHLQDRLNRMEALLREPTQTMITEAWKVSKTPFIEADIRRIWSAMSAALLAKLEK